MHLRVRRRRIYDFLGYDVTVQQVLAAQNNNCDSIVKSAFSQLLEVYQKNGLSPILQMFNTCPQSGPIVIADVTSTFQIIFSNFLRKIVYFFPNYFLTLQVLLVVSSKGQFKETILMLDSQLFLCVLIWQIMWVLITLSYKLFYCMKR